MTLHRNVHSSFIKRKSLQASAQEDDMQARSPNSSTSELFFKAQSERLEKLGAYEPERRNPGRQTELHLLARGWGTRAAAQPGMTGRKLPGASSGEPACVLRGFPRPRCEAKPTGLATGSTPGGIQSGDHDRGSMNVMEPKVPSQAPEHPVHTTVNIL